MSSTSLITKFATQAAASYLDQMRTHEVRTKALTAGALNFLSEVLQLHFAGVPRKRVSKDASLWTRFLAYFKIEGKAFKMGLYGALFAAPVGHYILHMLLDTFGHIEPMGGAIVGAISMLVIAPLQISCFLTARAIANKEKSVKKSVKSAFLPVLIVTYLTFPPTIAYAQAKFPHELEAPILSLLQFLTGTFFNSLALAAEVRAAKKQGKDKDQ